MNDMLNALIIVDYNLYLKLAEIINPNHVRKPQSDQIDLDLKIYYGIRFKNDAEESSDLEIELDNKAFQEMKNYHNENIKSVYSNLLDIPPSYIDYTMDNCIDLTPKVPEDKYVPFISYSSFLNHKLIFPYDNVKMKSLNELKIKYKSRRFMQENCDTADFENSISDKIDKIESTRGVLAEHGIIRLNKNPVTNQEEYVKYLIEQYHNLQLESDPKYFVLPELPIIKPACVHHWMPIFPVDIDVLSETLENDLDGEINTINKDISDHSDNSENTLKMQLELSYIEKDYPEIQKSDINEPTSDESEPE